MLNFLSKNWFNILTLLTTLGIFVYGENAKDKVRNELAAIPVLTSRLGDYWITLDEIKLLVGSKKIPLDNIKITYFLLKNKSKTAIEEDSYVEKIYISTKFPESILSVESCAKGYSDQFQDAKNIPQSKPVWRKNHKIYELNKMFLNPGDSICVAIVDDTSFHKNGEDPQYTISGKLKNFLIINHKDSSAITDQSYFRKSLNKIKVLSMGEIALFILLIIGMHNALMEIYCRIKHKKRWVTDDADASSVVLVFSIIYAVLSIATIQSAWNILAMIVTAVTYIFAIYFRRKRNNEM